jgi:hypothetical protein
MMVEFIGYVTIGAAVALLIMRCHDMVNIISLHRKIYKLERELAERKYRDRC